MRQVLPPTNVYLSGQVVALTVAMETVAMECSASERSVLLQNGARIDRERLTCYHSNAGTSYLNYGKFHDKLYCVTLELYRIF